MNDSGLATCEFEPCGACAGPGAFPVPRRRFSLLSGFLKGLVAAPLRLHGYRNLNTRLVRDAFCVRDCGSGTDD